MEDPFHTTFSLGSVAHVCGWLSLTVAIYVLAIRLRSLLLRISSLALLLCAFSALASEAMPIRFGPVGANGQAHFSVWPPQWASWLALVGAPLALCVAGVAALAFALMQLRTRA